MRIAVFLFILVASMGLTGGSRAGQVFFDDFQDGDKSRNVEWHQQSSRGKSSIIRDPSDPANRLLSAHGTKTAHHTLVTYLDKKIPWKGFDCSMDFSSTENYYHPVIRLYDGSGGYVGLHVHSDPGKGRRTITLSLNGSDMVRPLIVSDPNHAWWKIRLWNPLSSKKLKAAIGTKDGKQVLQEVEANFPADMSGMSGIVKVQIGFEETTEQYADNISLSTEYMYENSDIPVTLENFALTSNTYSEDENLEEIVRKEFGMGCRIADWNDIVAYWNNGGTVKAFGDAFVQTAMITFNNSRC
ncbi:MAG: hypothetical protein MI892_20415, partial [Desulfobacterales bacterium]|nr:hypothetical protein [Desulfobacterales bacterium]